LSKNKKKPTALNYGMKIVLSLLLTVLC